MYEQWGSNEQKVRWLEKMSGSGEISALLLSVKKQPSFHANSVIPSKVIWQWQGSLGFGCEGSSQKQNNSVT